MHIVESNKIQNAFLIFIEIESLAQQTKLENDYEEFCSLVSSCDTKIKEKIKLNQKIPSTKTFLSQGKLENIKTIISRNDIDLIIINHKLTASQNRNLELYLNKRVIDKTELILDIFASRATSHIGKLQVELAQLNHLSTRLIRGWTHLERQKGGIGLRLLPGVLGNEASIEDESFSDDLLEYPQYTKPQEYKNIKVPDVLLSGNHEEIEKWRKEKSTLSS